MPSGKYNRSIDAEAGRPKIKRKQTRKSKKYISSTEESASDTEPEIKVVKKKLVKKAFTEDARRQVFEEDSDDHEEEEETPKGKGKTTRSHLSGQQAAATETGSVVAAYTALFTAFDVFGIIHPRQMEFSTYGVSFFGLFNLIYGMERCLYQNTRVNAILAEYFSLPARIYYAYMGLYQLLRAKVAAGIALPAMQRRIFRRLETELPLESCVIAGPLVPWFQSLGCYKPSDDYYGMIRPSVPGPAAGSTTLTHQTGNMYFFPPIPNMIAFMRALYSIPNSGNARNYMSEGGYLIPVNNDGNGTAVPYLGTNWEVEPTTAAHRNHAEIFSRPGLSLALPESTAELTSARKLALRRMAFPTVDATTNIGDLESYLFFGHGQSIEWLKRCREHANAQAMFFSSPANLSQISPTTDADPTVVCHPRARNAAPAVLNPYEQEDSGYCCRPIASDSLSANISETELKRATLNQILLPTIGAGHNATFPANFTNGLSTTISGPWYLSTDGETTTADDPRKRYRISTSGHNEVNEPMRTIIRQHLYKPNGTHAEPVIIVA